MSVNTRHYMLTAERRAEWQLIRDCMDGESAIKKRGETYLPKPDGFAAMSDGGVAAYNAYRTRAQFPELLAPSVSAMIGIIHGQEIKINLPSSLEYLWEDADSQGLPLEAFHRRITRELLTIGGYAVLTDMAETGGDPWLAGYSRDAVINWANDWFVLDETEMVRKGFVWERLEQYRVLTFEDAMFTAYRYANDASTGEKMEFRGRGGRALPRIPLAVGNAVDLSPKVEAPPLIGVANAAKAMYQLSADYRHQLFMSGQETLAIINAEAPDIIGAGTIMELRGAEGLTPDAKYVSPACSGIDAHERAMDKNREAAVMAGARLFEDNSGSQESGEAKRLRYASETATLTSVAQNSCLLLDRALKNVAMMIGAPEDDISVECPSDLMDRTMSPQDFAALFGVYREGGMSWETFFANGQRGGIFSTETTSEEEQRLLDGFAADSGDVV